MPYRNFATQEELDARYDLENTVANISLYIARRRARRSGRGWKHRLEVPLVPTLTEHLDLYPAPGLEHPAPVLVYSHGGYWWSQTSKAFGFVARGPTSRGVATVVVNYALRSEVTTDELVRRVWAAAFGTYGNPRASATTRSTSAWPETRRQSEDFFAAWNEQGLPGGFLPLPDKNHRDVIDGFRDVESSLCYAILRGINARGTKRRYRTNLR